MSIKQGNVKLKKLEKSDLSREAKGKKVAGDLNSQLMAEMMTKIRKMAHCSSDEESDHETTDFAD